jgi:anti-sigma factor ChrR (cupin superfamily)
MSGAHGQAAGRRTEHLFQLDLAESLNEAYAWVTRIQVAQFVGILSRMREEHREAMAMRALHAFALRRPVHELVRLADHFDGRDAVMLMATAALSRPVGEAAELALMQYEAESGGERAPITASIVHDVACQRTAFDVAVFVRVLEQREPTLAKRTVQVFASPGSGRTNLDKALLHTALRDEGCHREADRLLGLTLRAIADSPPGAAGPGGAGEEGEEMADLAGAFQHLSPAGRILERWVEERLNASDATEVERTRELVARLIARRGAGHDALAEHIGRTAQPRHVVKLCALLARGDTASPAKCALVRQYAAAHKNVQELAVLVTFWHKEPALTRTTRELLTDIVAGAGAGVHGSGTDVYGSGAGSEGSRAGAEGSGAGAEGPRVVVQRSGAGVDGSRAGAERVGAVGDGSGMGSDGSRAGPDGSGAGPHGSGAVPRTLNELRQLDEWLRVEDADPQCSQMLGHAAAVHVEGRSGADLVTLLGRVARSRDRTRAADTVGRRLAMAVMRPDADRDRFVDCLRALHDARYSVAVRAACRELSDPSHALTVDAGLVADVAGRLHRAGLHKVAWTLLERLLENEQLVTPADVVEVVGGVLALPLPDAELLLRATVGRWSDVGHRDDAVTALRDAGRREAAEWVIKSLR